MQSRHYSYKEDNKHFYINDKENPYDEIKALLTGYIMEI